MVTAQVVRLKAEAYGLRHWLTLMPEDLYDAKWFPPNSLQSSVYLPE
jgi:hypothetical protein